MKTIQITDEHKSRIDNILNEIRILRPDIKHNLKLITERAIDKYCENIENAIEKKGAEYFENKAVCARCHKVKTVDQFVKNAAKRGGLHSYCKSCMCELAK